MSSRTDPTAGHAALVTPDQCATLGEMYEYAKARAEWHPSLDVTDPGWDLDDLAECVEESARWGRRAIVLRDALSAAPPPEAPAALVARARAAICTSLSSGSKQSCREQYGIGSWCDGCQLNAWAEMWQPPAASGPPAAPPVRLPDLCDSAFVCLSCWQQIDIREVWQEPPPAGRREPVYTHETKDGHPVARIDRWHRSAPPVVAQAAPTPQEGQCVFCGEVGGHGDWCRR